MSAILISTRDFCLQPRTVSIRAARPRSFLTALSINADQFSASPGRIPRQSPNIESQVDPCHCPSQIYYFEKVLANSRIRPSLSEVRSAMFTPDERNLRLTNFDRKF